MSSRSKKQGRESLLLVLLLLVALAYRLDFLIASDFRIDADEAIVGLMAKHILEDRAVPVFYYGQDYMGSLEALLASISFSLFGVSSLSLKLVPLAASLCLVLVFYCFLKATTSTRTAWVGALLMAVPAPTLVLWSAKARGGFIEVILIGVLACHWFFKWFNTKAKDWNYLYGSALLLGLGWWVNNQIIYFMLPIGLFSLFYLVSVNHREFYTNLRGMLIALLAFFFGGSCYWIHNLTKNFPSFGMFQFASQADIQEHFGGFLSTALPILVGAKRYWQTSDVFPSASSIMLAVYLLLISIFLIKIASCLYRLSSRGEYLQTIFNASDSSVLTIEQLKVVRLGLFMLIFSLGAVCIFCVSNFGYLSQAPRYLLPLYVGLFSLLALSLTDWRKKFQFSSIVVLLFLLVANLYSSYSGKRAIPGEPIVYKQERVAKSHDSLLEWLNIKQINWVRTNYWIGYRLAFESLEKIRFAVFQNPYQVRIASYHQEARSIGLETMPLVLTHGQAKIVRKALVAQGYLFKEHVVDSYLVIYDIFPMHNQTTPVELKDLVKVSSNTIAATGLADNDIQTRWGSAAPQHPEMFVSVEFPQTTSVKQLYYDLGSWVHDYPRGLRVQLQGAFGVRALISDEQYRALRYLRADESYFNVYFNPTAVKEIQLNQTGSDEVFDWSIAELKIYG